MNETPRAPIGRPSVGMKPGADLRDRFHFSVLPRNILHGTPAEWGVAVCCAALSAFLLFPLYEHISYWIGIGVMVGVVFLFHMVFFARCFVPVVHIVVLISVLQYVLAPWVAHYYPSVNPNYNIDDQIHAYITYAGPVVLAFAVGSMLPLMGLRGLPLPDVSKWAGDRRVLVELDLLIVAGVVIAFARQQVGLGFLGVLLANLRYPGLYGWMLLKRRGWVMRLAIILFIELLLAVNHGMFHHLVLWFACTFGIYLFVFRPKPRIIAVVLVTAAVMLPSMQYAKWMFRRVFWYGERDEVMEELDIHVSSPPLLFTVLLMGGAYKLVAGGYDDEFIADTAVRYNQGWIVNRVLNHVPESEPFARGETLVTALRAAVFPRIMMPDKYTAGGKEYMLRFANYRLLPSTSMNIGYAGEFYANYGRTGGIFACGMYGLLLGLLLRWAYRVCTRSSVLWCIWVPFVAQGALKAETGLADAVNWVIKSLVVVIAMGLVLPVVHRNVDTRRKRRRARRTQTTVARHRSSPVAALRASSSRFPQS